MVVTGSSFVLTAGDVVDSGAVVAGDEEIVFVVSDWPTYTVCVVVTVAVDGGREVVGVV